MGMNRGDNPADHNVEDVNAYLASADADERARVLEAEAAGKNRATVAAPNGDPATAESMTGDPDGLTAAEQNKVEPGAKADTESAAAGFETQDAPGSKTGSTGVVTPVYPSGQPVVANDMADPTYADRANDPDDDSVVTPTQPGKAQTEDEKLAAIAHDRDQQNAIAAAQGVDLEALRKAERDAAGLS